MRTHISWPVVLLAALLVGCSGGDQENTAAGSPGLVDVEGRLLYLICQGQGGPTVVMEAGGAGNSESWRFVQPGVAKFTRVCAYDRSGTGRSSSVPRHDTIQAIAEEMNALLTAAGIAPPYILVGHSLGGIIVRQFATQYPEEVVGMVLVDSSQGEIRARFQAVLTPEEWQRYGPPDDHGGDFLLPEGADLVGPYLAAVPLVVLSAGIIGGDDVPQDVAEKMQNVRLEMQLEMLGLSSNSSHIIAEDSDHGIPQNRPDLVVDAVRQVVEVVRAQEKQQTAETGDSP